MPQKDIPGPFQTNKNEQSMEKKMKNADEFHLSMGRGSFQSPSSLRSSWSSHADKAQNRLGHCAGRPQGKSRHGETAWIWSVAYGFQLLSIYVYPTLGYELSKSKLSYMFTIHITA